MLEQVFETADGRWWRMLDDGPPDLSAWWPPRPQPAARPEPTTEDRWPAVPPAVSPSPSPGRVLLREAVRVLLAESPAELPGPEAVVRLKELIGCGQLLTAATLTATRDLDVRQLFALDAAGSSRGWLRGQPGGDPASLTLARRLQARPLVRQALHSGQIPVRAAGQVCAALALLPDQLPEPVVQAVLQDGIGGPTGLLSAYTGGQLDPSLVTAAVRAARAETDTVLTGCADDTTAAPDSRLEPAFTLLARQLDTSHLGSALRSLLDAIRPDAADRDAHHQHDGYYLDLVELMDGDGDVRGHLDPITFNRLRDEITRRENLPTDPDESAAEPTDPGTTDPEPTDPEPTDRHGQPIVHGDPADGLLGAGARRYQALRQLLHDLAGSTTEPGTGQPPTVELLLVASTDALTDQPGALPAQLDTPRSSIPIRPTTLQRMACTAAGITTVLHDSTGHPISAATTRRHADKRQRRALRTRWGPRCAVRGCRNRATVPHHIIPWWLGGPTTLNNLAPLCEHHHHDLHDGHRTLRLRDNRLIDQLGWVRPDRT